MIHDLMHNFGKYVIFAVLTISAFLVLKKLFEIVIGLLIFSGLVWFYFLK